MGLQTNVYLLLFQAYNFIKLNYKHPTHALCPKERHRENQGAILSNSFGFGFVCVKKKRWRDSECMENLGKIIESI